MAYTIDKPNQETFDLLVNKEILIGYCTREAYSIARYKRWFDDWYEKQEPEKYYLDKLDRDFLSHLHITIFSATWCGSCRTELARFYKIFDLMNLDFDKVTVWYVNKTKQIPGIDLSDYNLTRVPTFIFSFEGEEIARITERPEDTLEAELFKIQLQNQ